MVGIRSPIGLVVGSCTSHPGVLGSIPKREEPGKTGAPCVKVPGSSRVPAPPWVGSRSPDGWDQIPYRPGGWVLHQPPWSFGFDSQTRGTRENRRTLCKSTGFLTGPRPSLLTVYVGVVECASASPYTYSTHRFPDERTYRGHASFSDICGAWVGFGSGFGIEFTLLVTRSSPSRHPPFTQYPSPSRSLVRDGQTSPHKPPLVVPHSTCPSLSPSPPRTQLYNRSCSNKHTHQDFKVLRDHPLVHPSPALPAL